MLDVLVIGSGPAGLTMAAALCQTGLRVDGLSATAPTTPWPNTYGIWCDELAALGLEDLLAHRWQNSVGYFGQPALALDREYGLLNKDKFQQYLLTQCQSMIWHQGLAVEVAHFPHYSMVATKAGESLQARLVIDATGHQSALVKRPAKANVAYQAAYGIVGTFSKPPIEPGQFVLMDYRDSHLAVGERSQPPTFLYAMDLGENVFFLEETSLAASPAVSFDTLKQRLHQRLIASRIAIQETHDVEHCLFPMNLPLPDLHQRVVGFGGAASMVHPATGYMVGALLRRAPAMATAIAAALRDPQASPALASQTAWQTLWPREKRRKHHIYSFGLEALMRFENPQLCRFFDTFFHLSRSQWSGFLADTLSTPALVAAMLQLFGQAPPSVRSGLMQSAAVDTKLLWHSLTA